MTEKDDAGGSDAGLLSGIRILLVDDEALVRLAAADMLESFGAIVTEADSSEAALDQFAKGPGFDLLIADLMMPNGGGCALAERACGLDPKLSVLIFSGSAPADRTAPRWRYLAKPFRPDELEQAVLAALNDGADSSD